MRITSKNVILPPLVNYYGDSTVSCCASTSKKYMIVFRIPNTECYLDMAQP